MFVEGGGGNGSVRIEPTDSWRQRCLTSGAPHYLKSGITFWGVGSPGTPGVPIRLRTRPQFSKC
jgi:hypothetical protein